MFIQCTSELQRYRTSTYSLRYVGMKQHKYELSFHNPFKMTLWSWPEFTSLQIILVLSPENWHRCACIFHKVLMYLYWTVIKNSAHVTIRLILKYVGLVWFTVFNATFNNISVISWPSVLLVEETGVSGETTDLSQGIIPDCATF